MLRTALTSALRSSLPRASARAAAARRSYAGGAKSDSFINPKNITVEVTPLFIAVGLMSLLAVGSVARHLFKDEDIRLRPGENKIDVIDDELKAALAEPDNNIGKSVAETNKH